MVSLPCFTSDIFVKHKREDALAEVRELGSGELFPTAASAAQQLESLPIFQFFGAGFGAATVAEGSGSGFTLGFGDFGCTDGSRPSKGTLSG